MHSGFSALSIIVTLIKEPSQRLAVIICNAIAGFTALKLKEKELAIQLNANRHAVLASQHIKF